MAERATTEKQQRILAVIREFTSEQGYPPSVREIGERVGLSSSSTVQSHLKTLERRGLLRRDPTKPRALVAAPAEGADVQVESVTLPVVGRVAAGAPITATENVEDHFVLPAAWAPRSGGFLLRVKGESMIDAAILDGDLIVVQPADRRERRDRRRDDGRRGDRQAVLPRARADPVAAGERDHGANLRRRCHRRRPSRSRHSQTLTG